MQQKDKNVSRFQSVVGNIIKENRENKAKTSLNNFARSYGLDRGNLSKIERGIIGCRLETAWKISEALNIRFSDFAKLIEDRLGQDFKLLDE